MKDLSAMSNQLSALDKRLVGMSNQQSALGKRPSRFEQPAARG
jgi:hypothetical protein